jgi:hypothetical protein
MMSEIELTEDEARILREASVMTMDVVSLVDQGASTPSALAERSGMGEDYSRLHLQDCAHRGLMEETEGGVWALTRLGRIMADMLLAAGVRAQR